MTEQNEHTPAPEPRSSAQAELGGGMYTYYQEGDLPVPGLPEPEPRNLTSAQKNFRARRIESEHLQRKNQLEPNDEAIRMLSEEDRVRALNNIRKVRDSLNAGSQPTTEPTYETPQLPFPENHHS